MNRQKSSGPNATVRRQCLILDLVDEAAAIRAYREWHRPDGPPAAVSRSIRKAGIREMEIFLSGNRLVMIMDVGPEFDPAAKAAADAADPEVVAWEELMGQFQRPVAWAAPGEKWVPAEPIYRLSDQP